MRARPVGGADIDELHTRTMSDAEREWGDGGIFGRWGKTAWMADARVVGFGHG